MQTVFTIGLVDGVTTNPSIIAKSGRDFKTVIADICKIVDGPVSAEVTATEADKMLVEGRELRKIAEVLRVCRSLRMQRMSGPAWVWGAT